MAVENEGTEQVEQSQEAGSQSAEPQVSGEAQQVQGEGAPESGQAQLDLGEFEKRLQGLETGIAEERKKRQAAEEEAQLLRNHMAQIQQHQPQQQPQQVDWSQEEAHFWESPAQHVARVAAETAEHIASQKVAAMEQQRMHASRERVAAKHADYYQKIAKFQQMAAVEPHLWSRVTNAAEPAQAAYDLVVERETYGATPQEWERRKEAEIRARVEAEMRAAKGQQAASGSPPTQAGARNVPGNSAEPGAGGAHVLDDLFEL